MAEIALAKMFERLGEYYWTRGGVRPSGDGGLDPKEYFRAQADGDWRKALLYFVDGYAFERNVRVERYVKAAKEVIKDRTWSPSDRNFEKAVWARFKKKAGERLNEKNNPMATSTGGQISLQRFVSKQLAADEYNIARWAKNRLQEGQATDAHGQLKKIRGISDKIASFICGTWP